MALPQELSVYEQLLARLEEADYRSPLLLAIQKDLREQRASNSLHRLAKLADLAAMRRNVFFFLVANTACLWDLHCTARLFAWKEANGRSLRRHLTAWAEVEALLSSPRRRSRAKPSAGPSSARAGRNSPARL